MCELETAAAGIIQGAGHLRPMLLRPPGLMDPSLSPLSLLAALCSLCLVLAINETTTTPSPNSLTDSERLAAIIVPSVVGGIIIIGILAFFIVKVKEKRQTEGTYRPSSEEQVGSRVESNAALKLPPEERLI